MPAPAEPAPPPSGDDVLVAARSLVGALYAADPPVAQAELFSLREGDATARSVLLAREEALAAAVGAPVAGTEAQLRAILAVHTAVALVAWLDALRLTAGPGPLRALADADDGALHEGLGALESGATLHGHGVDLVDPADPYAWYLTAWTARVAAAVRSVCLALPTFPPPGALTDPFAALTEALTPPLVRHALGAFYTPAWLADRVVDEALRHTPPGWRALDPCCGSGAFLVPILRHVLADTVGLPRAARLHAVLSRVAGVDLHPLAVRTARVNVLRGVATLLAPGDVVRLPVHRGDATAGDDGLPAPLGRFDAIVGNPPWVDWRRLPPAHRDAFRARVPSRHLFAGDRLVGGVNLNVCAVVAGVAAETWLAPDGVLSFLMPRSVAFQQSYAGLRSLRRGDGGPFRLLAIEDWSRAGRPFAPVTEPVVTWTIGGGPGAPAHAPLTRWVRPAGASAPSGSTFAEALPHLRAEHGVAGSVGTGLAFAADAADLARFADIAGTCAYLGREGLELYPQEVWLFEPCGPAGPGLVRVRNHQAPGSRYRVPERELVLEADWLHPLVRGVDIDRFAPPRPRFVVPFPYAPGERSALPTDVLTERAPRLAAWLREHAALLAAQSPYTARLTGADRTPHALARVGPYTWADVWVAFRDNTRWGATVVSELSLEPLGPRRPRFQNHAVTVCERADRALLTEEEAHYVCGALNAPVVARFLAASSDTRSFKIRPPVRVPLFRPDDPLHRALAALSREAHAAATTGAVDAAIDRELDAVFVRIAKG